MSEEIPPEEPGPRLPGVAYPLIALVFGGALVWSFSRILLAATGFTIRVGHTKVLSMDGKQTAVALALFMALNILVGSALIAYGRRVRSRPAAFPFLVVAGLALIGAGIVAAAVFGDHPEEAKAAASGPAPQTVTLTASGTKFLQTSLAFTAGARVTVQFQNKDSGVQHNFALFQGKDASGPVIFRGDLVTGPGTAPYTFTAPPPGTYFFHCDVHPTAMFGSHSLRPSSRPPGRRSPSTSPTRTQGPRTTWPCSTARTRRPRRSSTATWSPGPRRSTTPSPFLVRGRTSSTATSIRPR